jgi:hypothetical protein
MGLSSYFTPLLLFQPISATTHPVVKFPCASQSPQESIYLPSTLGMATDFPVVDTAAISKKELTTDAVVGGTSDLSNGGVEDAEKILAADSAKVFVHEYVTGIKVVLILIPPSQVYFLLMLDASVIATAIPSVTFEFDSLL